jgi:hypothetical protein
MCVFSKRVASYLVLCEDTFCSSTSFKPKAMPFAVVGWERHLDQSTGKHYYHQLTTGKTTWKEPVPASGHNSFDSDGSFMEKVSFASVRNIGADKCACV